MTALAPPIPGPAEATSGDTDDCSSLSTNGVLARLDSAYVRQPDLAGDDAWVGAIKSAVDGLGIAGLHSLMAFRSPMFLLSQIIPQGRYLIVGVNVTSDCVLLTNGDSRIRHWVAAYSTDGDFFNCWRNTFERANLDAAYNPSMGCLILWRDGAIPVSNPQPTSGIPTEEVMTLAQAKATATMWLLGFWFGNLHRSPPSLGAVELPDNHPLVQALLAGDSNAVVTTLTTAGQYFGAPEFATDEAALHKLIWGA